MSLTDLKYARVEIDKLKSTLTTTQEENVRLREAIKTKDATLEKLASWLDTLAEHAELRAKDTRFITLSEANRLDALNYRATAKSARAALKEVE